MTFSVTGPTKGDNGLVWDIKTDFDPQTLSAVGAAIAKKWIEFAMGQTSLGDKMLMHPTGKYASAIDYRKYGESRIAIVANEKRAPEAGYLEEERKAVDLKQYFRRGQYIPMVRGSPTGTSSGPSRYEWSGQGYGIPIRDTRQAARRNNIWAMPRALGDTGFALMSATGWVIPPMPAYSPAATLVDLIKAGDFDPE